MHVLFQIYEDSIVLQTVFTNMRERLEKDGSLACSSGGAGGSESEAEEGEDNAELGEEEEADEGDDEDSKSGLKRPDSVAWSVHILSPLRVLHFIEPGPSIVWTILPYFISS